jgi:hypothetical protein
VLETLSGPWALGNQEARTGFTLGTAAVPDDGRGDPVGGILKFFGSVIGIIFLIGLLVVIGLLMLIF